MNLTKTLLPLAITLALPLAADATPTVNILSPKKGNTTNAVLNASGTAAGGIDSVYYSFNGSDWTAAAGTTNWSVAGLILTPGSNVFSAYALGTNATVSRTNKLIFTYVVDVPLTVLTNGSGKVSPDFDGKLLQIQKVYTMTAKAAKGFGFTGWTGSANTNSAKLKFLMASNLTFTASFADIQRPVCIITFPAVKHSVSNSPITITGRTSDNVGVTAVNFQLNGAGWNAAALGVEGTNWTAANVTLTPGTNVAQAYAMDAAGNLSLTNTVKFTYVVGPVTGPAPASLSGLVGEVQVEGQDPFEISFGLSTFANGNPNGDGFKVGNYTYTLLSSNMAQLTTTAVLPPDVAGDAGGPLFTFTDDNTATFTTDDGSNGVVTFASAADLVPSPSSIITVQSVDSGDYTNITTFGGGAFTNQDTDGNVTGSGTYSLQPFSPVAALLQLNFTDDVNTDAVDYVELTFATSTTGAFLDDFFDALGDPPATDTGSFTILSISNPPAGHAPLSIAGFTAAVTQPGRSTFHVSFGANTYSQSASDTNENNLVGDYTFMKTGPNTAQLVLTSLAPPTGDLGVTVVPLTFSSSSSATFSHTNEDNSVDSGSVSLALAANLASASLAGKTVTVTSSGRTDTVTLNVNGTFSHVGSNGTDNSGVYTYSPYSPVGGLMILHITSGIDVGFTAYVELTFSSLNLGTAYLTSFDNMGVQQNGATRLAAFKLK